MEVMHHHIVEVEVEAAAEAEIMEEPLVLVERRKTRYPDNVHGFHSDQELDKNRISENSIYFDDMNGGLWKCRQCIWTYKPGNIWVDHFHQKSFSHGNGEYVKAEGLDILKLVNAVINTERAGNDLEDTVVSGLMTNKSTYGLTSSAGNDVEDTVVSGLMTNKSTYGLTSSAGNDLEDTVVSGLMMTNKSTYGLTSREVENKSVGAKEKGRTGMVKESEDEVLELEFEEEIELEFERAVEKVHTHNAYCPNCKKRITKVVLRRRKGDSKPGEKPLDRDSKPGEKPLDGDSKPLFGCLSCFSIFIPSGNRLNLLGLFKGKEKDEENDGVGSNIPRSKGSTSGSGSTNPGASPDPNGIKSLEMLKCIVYGGLVESLTSLCVVSSAAASDAKTLNIIALGLANVIGGLFVIAQNLVDLKTEVSGVSPNQETNRYQELLGRRAHFPLHATVAILSFLAFGLIPPVVYGFAFRVSDNKDYKILAVAASSLASIIILATAKTYTKKPEKFNAYIKTILYYCTMAFTVSGVSYAAGDLIKMLMQKLDWFEPSPGAGAGAASSFISNMNPATPAWAYY